MKLLPKARAVQISKLRLGQTDIQSLDDLLHNFYISDIIELDSKFIQWLSRIDNSKANEVDKIFKEQKTNEDMIYHLLLCFFGNLINNDNCFYKVLFDWGINQTLDKLENALRLIEPNISIAIYAMESQFVNKNFMDNWLKECSLNLNNSSVNYIIKGKFCFLYYKYLTSQKVDDASNWLIKSKNFGYKDAVTEFAERREIIKQEIENRRKTSLPKTLNIYIYVNDKKFVSLSLNRVVTSDDDFYISSTLIKHDVFTLVQKQRQIAKILSNYSPQLCDTCEGLLSFLSEKNKYGVKFDFPTRKQYIEAQKIGAIYLASENKVEWCERIKGNGRLLSNGRKADNSEKALLRPVINLKDHQNVNLL